MSSPKADPPLVSLTDIALGFGGAPLFSGLSAAIGPGDRLAVVGRNGSGKSTLLKVLAGLVAADAGERFVQPGARIAYLPQEPDLTGFKTLGDFAAAELEDHERYKAEMAMEGLEVRADAAPESASGGEQRRAALARALAGAPDLLLLDEPTNHLDIRAIEWLEGTLSGLRAGFALISHDRAFLARLTRATLWIDRGAARRLDEGFAAFEAWRDKTFEEEEQERQKLSAKIRREEHWIVHGVSGRRKRNMRRVAELAALKDRRRAMTGPTGAAAMALETGGASGKLAIEAKSIAKRFGDREIVSDFSLRVQRGDRIALVGPNGVGKTTLLKMLTGALAPDAGSVRLGANLELAVFDQARAVFDPSLSLWETLTGDKALKAPGKGDHISVRGRPKHVVGYLKEFLFDDAQARGPVAALSGGERARLLLARIMARTSNLLVLDEPTNDFDVETLDLLQELLIDYEGTLLLVSHDRDFIDRVAATTIAMEGDGRAVIYAGGWSDYRAQRAAGLSGADDAAAKRPARDRKAQAETAPAAAAPAAAAPPTRKKLSFKETRRLDALPGEIDRLTAEIAKLSAFLAQPDLYQREPKKFAQATELLAERETRLAAAEDEWLTLESLREDAAG